MTRSPANDRSWNTGGRANRSTDELCEFLWHPTGCNGAEILAVSDGQAPVVCATQGVCLLEHRVENRGEVAGRGIDDLQHLGGGGLLLQCLARLGNEPRILHRDDRLRREILDERDLFLGERPHFLAGGDDLPEQRSSLRSATKRIVRMLPSATPPARVTGSSISAKSTQ